MEGTTALPPLQHLCRALVLLQHTYKSFTYSLAKTDEEIFLLPLLRSISVSVSETKFGCISIYLVALY